MAFALNQKRSFTVRRGDASIFESGSCSSLSAPEMTVLVGGAGARAMSAVTIGCSLHEASTPSPTSREPARYGHGVDGQL